MICPLCNLKLNSALLSGVGIDYCPRCYGLWFEEDELQWAKDEKDRNLRWLDIDLWRDPARFRISRRHKLCPHDRMPLYEVRYGDSVVKVDLCNLCHGVWLDRGEFKEIISYLKEKGEHNVLYHYLKNLAEELWEVFQGPEVLREELLDFLTVLKLLRYKLSVQYPHLWESISLLPR